MSDKYAHVRATLHMADKGINVIANSKKSFYANAVIRDLLAERDALKEALEMIAGIRPCPDVLMGNVDIARAALAQEQGEKT